MASSNIDIIIQAQDKTANAFNGASSGLSSFKSKVDDLQPAFQNMAKVGTVAFAAITGVAISMVNAFADAQAQTEITNQSLSNSLDNLSKGALAKLKKDTGDVHDGFAGLANAAIEAGNAAVKLGFDDEVASRSFAKLFSVTKDVTKANTELAMAQDLARFKGISLEDATQKLIMVHSGATKELKLMGIAVDENASAEQNLQSIHKQTAASAETFAMTTKGAMEVLKVQTDNLQESIGGALEPVFARLLTAVSPIIEKFAAWADANPDLLAKIILIAGAISGLVAVAGILGMALPAVIAGFTLLSGPVGIIALAIGVLVAGFLAFREQIAGIMSFLEDIGVLDYFRQIWESISTTFTNVLLPAFQKLWDSLVKLKPVFEVIGTIVGGALLLAIMALAKALEIIINLFVNVLAIAMKVASFMADVFVKAFNVVKDAVQWLIEKFQQLISTIESLLATAKKIGGNILGSIGGAISNIFKVNDAVIAPGGNVISTHPDDYLIATKDPSSLGGAGSGLTININGGTFLDENVAAKIGDMLINTLNLNMRGS